MNNALQTCRPRQRYTPPHLVRYGSVRNLTGGSGNNGRDGGVSFTKN